jgi:hypothetical protein
VPLRAARSQAPRVRHNGSLETRKGGGEYLQRRLVAAHVGVREPLRTQVAGTAAAFCRIWCAEALALSLLVFARCRIWLLCDPVIPGIGGWVPGAGVSGAVPAGAPVTVLCATA